MNPTTGGIGTRYRAKGKHWARGYHTGVDYLVPNGTRVNAPAESTITYAGRYGGWGRAYGKHVIGVTIIGGVRYQWMVAHLSVIGVSKGQNVVAGQLVGLSGSTGNVTGPHVHFEVRKYPYRYGDDVNPAVLINHQPGPVDRMEPANYGPGHVGEHITWLGQRLILHGFGDYYELGPGPVWGSSDRANVREFQKAQGWSGPDADGFPGVETLRRLAKNPV